jgi:hypothetical protein
MSFGRYLYIGIGMMNNPCNRFSKNWINNNDLGFFKRQENEALGAHAIICAN